MTDRTDKRSFARTSNLGGQTPPVCRFGLATRGNTHLDPTDVHRAVDAGVNYLNWCAHPDGMSRAIAELSSRQREQVVVAMQFFARSADDAGRELEAALRTLGTDYVDVITFYYVEHEAEWNQIAGPGGALEGLQPFCEQGTVRRIGMTTHQRPLAAQVARSGRLDLLMLRYNAAHRGAETEVFPTTRELGMPVVAFTGLRWGALLEPTPNDPPEFRPPPAREWYRFVLAQPAVAVALMAPNGADELNANLAILNDWHPPSPEQMNAMRAHGDRVCQNAGNFP